MEIHKIKNCKLGCIEKLTKMILSINESNEKYESFISEIKKLNIEIKDKLFLIKAYNKKFIDSIKSGCDIYFMQTLVIEKINESNAYIKSIKFVEKIIENLKENSRLFEIFLYLDSNSIENLLVKNDILFENFIDIYGIEKQIEYKKNPTEYGTNLSSIEEVKNHLLKLMPKYVIRLDTDMKFNASYDEKSKIMLLNEKRLFNSKSSHITPFLENNNLNEKYILPIAMEILHELCGHGKKRLINDREGSTEEFRDSKSDYRRCHVNKKVSVSKIIKYPESGIVLENYISNNKSIIKWLKIAQNNREEILKIMDVNLWVDKDFTKLENLVQGFIISSGSQIYSLNSIYSINVNKNDEEIIFSDDEDTCGFHKYEC